MTGTLQPQGLDPSRLAELSHAPLDDSAKGVPLGVTTTLAQVSEQGWNVARGDLSLPVTTLYADALDSNVQTMADYCERHGVSFAPHGKTTMSPQLFDRQLRAGAWGLTCATPTQAAVMRRFGAQRILMANEMTEAGAWRWAAAELDGDPDFDFYSLVDSVEAVRHVDGVLASVAPARAVDVLLEFGVDGGRGGVRTTEQATRVARAVADSAHLRLVGVEAYEGLVTDDSSAEALSALDEFLARFRDTVVELARAGLLEGDEVIVTAGGSAYFDRVTAALADWSDVDGPVRVVLRSGCYISHDGGRYHDVSPLDGRATHAESLRLHNALTTWASVLSCPEPGLAILGAGKRDVAHDLSFPEPRTLHRTDGSSVDLRGRAETFRLMDQHAFLRLEDGLELAPGDIVAMDSSHPCMSFDKMPFIPVIDRENNVVDAVSTIF